MGSRTSPRKRSLTNTFLWCTLRVAGSFLIQEKLVLEKTKRRRLGSSKIGFFTLIVHTELPLKRVSQVCVKLYPSGRIHVIFLVEEAEAEESNRRIQRKLWVWTWVSQGLQHFQMVRCLENPKPLERSLERIRVLQRTLSRKRFLSKNWLKTKTKLAKEHEHLKDFRRDLFFKLGALLSQEYDVLVLEDLDVQGLIQKSEIKREG